MDTSPADRPDSETISGKRIDTSSAFGGASVLGRDAESRLNDLSGTPDGFPKAANTSQEEELQQILGGKVPKSTGTETGP